MIYPRATCLLTAEIALSLALALSSLPRANARALPSPACDSADVALAVTPAVPDNSKALRRSKVQGAELPERAKLVLVGDSLAEAFPADLLSVIAGSGEAVNLGAGRDRIQNTLWRLSDEIFSKRQLGAEEVVVIEGTNNIPIHEKPCFFNLATLTLVQRIHHIWPQAQISWLEVLPRGKSLTDFEADRKILNAELDNMSGWLPYFDFINADIITCKATTECQIYQPDYLHLTRAGYEKLAELIANSLDHRSRLAH